MHTYSYADRLSILKLYSLQRRRDRYTIIYIWKILESIVPNLNKPITCYNSIKRGRLCVTSHVGIVHLGTLVYHSFRFRGICLFNAVPKHIRNISSCSVSSFKYQLDKLLNTIPGVMLNIFSGWPIGPAKINFGWPAVSFTCLRYYYRFW